jgi:3-phosphoshikimate 1-carboxyvinyltransferase
MSEGTSTVRRPLICDDTEATLESLVRLGAEVRRTRGAIRIAAGCDPSPARKLDCRESGTTLRLLTPVCGTLAGPITLTGGPSLSRRPVGPLVDALTQLGVDTKSAEGYPPVTVHGEGRVPGGSATIRGDVSSQFVSALLMVAPTAERDTEIVVTNPLESRPYVRMTMDAMRLHGVEAQASADMSRFAAPQAGYRPAEVEVEGDWSSAAPLLAAGAMGGDVAVKGLSPRSSQADTAILGVLGDMGAELHIGGDNVRAVESRLSATNMDLSDCPDLFPVVSALAAAARGVSSLSGLRRLRLKESDRLQAMMLGLGRMGASLRLEGERLLIRGGSLKGAEVDPRGDHRIAMAFAALALAAEGTTVIHDAECVSKSYPGFWRDMARLGVGE